MKIVSINESDENSVYGNGLMRGMIVSINGSDEASDDSDDSENSENSENSEY